MKIRIAFAVILALIITSGLSAQETLRVEKKAYVSDAYAELHDEGVRSKLDTFFAAVSEHDGNKGLVVIYGPLKVMPNRKRLVLNHIKFRGMDPSRFDFRFVGAVKEGRTDLWVVPQGAERPEIERKAWIALEIGNLKSIVAKDQIKGFFDDAFFDQDTYSIVIINYGNDVDTLRREKLIANNIPRRPEFPEPRITLVRGGNGRQKSASVFWIVPPGGKVPTP